MKNLKKILLILGLFVALFAFGLISNPASAAECQYAACSEADITAAKDSFEFIDQAHIEGTFRGQTVIFTNEDIKGDSGERVFKAQSGAFCDGGGDHQGSIKISGDNFQNFEPGKPVTGQLDVDYHIVGDAGGDSCQDWEEPEIQIKNPGNAAARSYLWDGTSIVSADGQRTLTNYSDDGLFYTEADSCNGLVVILDKKGGNIGKEFAITDQESDFANGIGNRPPANENNILKKYYKSGGCYIKSGGDDGANVTIGGTSQQNIDDKKCDPNFDSSCTCTAAGVCTTTYTGITTTSGGSTPFNNTACGSIETCLKGGGDSSACVASSHTSLEWILCPVITAISKFSDVVNNFVESQLNFKVNTLLPDNKEVHRAWTIIKNVVSGLIVILMLIMVISQAVGGSFFDAYTVKKLLPRIVIAVIVMQFSWVLTKWLISVSNDLGIGIKQLMVAPFGGGGGLDLPSILHNLHPAFPALTTAAIFGILLLFLFTPASTFILPAFLFIGLAIGAALLTAFVTLIFRNILIIMAVIFSPLAILLWASPGQTLQGYWKKYADNFLKLLVFFPLVMAMIYSGRIAAWIASDLGAAGPFDYLVILIAFFGPYFLLPKAFRWGGSLLALASQAVRDNKVLNSVKGFGNRRIGAMAQERSGRLAKEWKPDDDYLRLGKRQFGSGKFWQRGGRLNPLALATTTAMRDARTGEILRDRKGKPIRVGRKMTQLQGRKAYGLGGGAFFEKGLSNEGMIRRGEQFKKTKDEAASTRSQRRKEFGRDLKNASYAVTKNPDGTYSTDVIPKGKGPPSPRAAIWQKMLGLNSIHEREQEETAVDLAGDADAPINLANRLKMDPTGAVGRHLEALKKRYGLKGDYEAGVSDRRGTRDSRLMADLEALKATHDLDHIKGLKRKVKEGSATADEEAELDRLTSTPGYKRLRDLQFLYDGSVNGGWRIANERLMTGAEMAAVQENLKLAEHIPGAIEDIDDPDNVLHDLNAQLAPTEQVKYTPPTLHPKWQKKIAGTSEQAQALANFAAQNLAVITEKFASMGFKPGQYTWADVWRYYLTDHAAHQRLAGTGEAFHKDNEVRLREAKRNFDIGEIPDNVYGRPPDKLPADQLIAKMAEDLEMGDQNIYAIVSHWRAIDSTRRPIDDGLGEGGLHADDIFGDTHDINGEETGNKGRLNLQQMYADADAAGDEATKDKIRRTIKGTLELHRKLGMKYNDARKNSTRDFLILAEATQMRRYGYTFDQVKDFFDREVDPEGALQYQSRLVGTEDEGEFIQRIEATFGADAVPREVHIPPTPGVQPIRSWGASEENVPRWQMAQRALNTMGYTVSLNRAQQLAVERAHNIGAGQPGKDPSRPAGVGNYTVRQLWEKANILETAGFDRTQRRLLMEQGIVGAEDIRAAPTNISALEKQAAELLRQSMEATDQSLRKQLVAQYQQAQQQIQSHYDEIESTAFQALSVETANPITAPVPVVSGSGDQPPLRFSGVDQSRVDPQISATLAGANNPAIPLPGVTQPLTLDLNPVRQGPTKPAVVPQPTIIRQTVDQPAQATPQTVSLREGTGELSTGRLHHYEGPSGEAIGEAQLKTERAMQAAIREAMKPIREATEKSTAGGGQANINPAQAAQRAGQVYRDQGGGAPPTPRA